MSGVVCYPGSGFSIPLVAGYRYRYDDGDSTAETFTLIDHDWSSFLGLKKRCMSGVEIPWRSYQGYARTLQDLWLR